MMNNYSFTSFFLAKCISVACLAALPAASTFALSPVPSPPMPGMTSGLGMMGNGMVHSEVAVQNHVVSVALRDGPSGPANPATRLVAGVAGLFASPFDVLNGQAYNAQYGWLEDQTIGFTPIDIASDEFIWIEQTNVTGPGIVAVYEGGNGMQMPNHTMDPILNTPGSLSSAWMWDEGFKMQHNWYAFSAPGDYDVDYRVYVGDASGAAISGYTDGAVTFQFTAVPEPASSTLLLTTGLLGLCRRRRA